MYCGIYVFLLQSTNVWSHGGFLSKSVQLCLRFSKVSSYSMKKSGHTAVLSSTSDKSFSYSTQKCCQANFCAKKWQKGVFAYKNYMASLKYKVCCLRKISFHIRRFFAKYDGAINCNAVNFCTEWKNVGFPCLQWNFYFIFKKVFILLKSIKFLNQSHVSFSTLFHNKCTQNSVKTFISIWKSKKVSFK